MNDHDDDLPLGVPIMTPRHERESANSTRPNVRRVESNDDLGRHPADELGLAAQLPIGMHTPTQEEIAAVKASEELEGSQLYDEAAEARFGRFDHWGRLVDRTLLLAFLSLAALLALFVFSQTVQILEAVAVQPAPLQWLGFAGLTGILTVIAILSIRLIVLFWRLRVNQQVSAAQLRELSHRAELRAFAQRDKASAKKHLEDYLRDYPLELLRIPITPGAFRLGPETIAKLREARDYLLDQEQFSDYDRWLDDFRTRFQDSLQEPADKIVQDWMRLAGVKTAVSSFAVIDAIVVLYCSYGMIGDLCGLYNLRMSRPGTLRLMSLVLLSAYASGQIEEHADELAQLAKEADPGFMEMIGVKFHEVFEGIPFAGPAIKATGKRFADGLANALLMRKLGRTTIALLRPIKPE